ncbi:oxygen-regulated invasion protein OrgB [Pseudomonas fluorescens HK44]|uniref:Oxygen-regulated invasion protein OrgB n=1 Tax=Pseudomonas fluorescens HK44 TaxID=1042209 RepID=A0A010SZR0_PSEFL|nr:oxygen-regulated invasion protein OrgB [Pseudomonas fluorescens]EXF96163.1 oxygen-regulated invasion protein OrgB [Pseudomonas fluorescens HK44]
MLDSIRTLTDMPASSDARICREDIVAARQRHSLQHQAQRWARECVDQAQRDAKDVRAQAFQEGYAEGVVRAAESLASGLLESQALGLQLRKDLAQAARQLLGDLLNRGEWLDEMLERWLAEQSGHADAVLQVLLPMRCKPRGNELRQRLQAFWPGTLSLDFQPQERYVFRLADQLLEFDIEASGQQLEPKLLSCLARLPESVRTLDQVSMQRLRDLCQSFGEMRHEN